MTVFPERIVADLAQLPGAQHSFLKQICAPDGEQVRSALEATVSRLGPDVGDRATQLLTSLDNRRFFQGFAEVATLASLESAGWRATGLRTPGPRIDIARPGSPNLILSTLAFLHQTRPGGDEENRRRLVEALSRVNGKHRFSVLIRRWLPHNFDPEPVRRAIEMWLSQVQAGAWSGRYAPYEDDHVSLEFCLTGEKVKGRASPVALTLGPFYAHRALAVLEPRAVQELDRHAASSSRDEPMVLACVSDQPWNITPGYLRDFLYGRASRTSTGAEGSEFEFDGSPSVCAFRDPLYNGVSAILLLDRAPARPTVVRATAWLNPWASTPLDEDSLGVRAFAPVPATSRSAPVMRWSAHPREHELK